METTYFSTFFHEKAGLAFKDWRRFERIKRAQVILQAKDTQITQIAFEVGFSDITTFERAFKRVVGMSPREYRKRNKPI